MLAIMLIICQPCTLPRVGFVHFFISAVRIYHSPLKNKTEMLQLGEQLVWFY